MDRKADSCRGVSSWLKPLRRHVRNWLMDAGSRLLWRLHMYGTCGSFDAWCDSHGRWDTAVAKPPPARKGGITQAHSLSGDVSRGE